MSLNKKIKDRHLPTWFLDNPLRRLFNNGRVFNNRVKQDQVVADLGCGPGFYTFPLAETVGPQGRVYAVDSDEKEVRKVQQKAQKKNRQNIEARTSSAAKLEFIATDSVDFVLANGLLC
jgi:ubiquinone/menaquinone biosynthesis C-methylase UbiE